MIKHHYLKIIFVIGLFVCLSWQNAVAQEAITMEEAVQLAIKNNPGVQAAGYKVDQQAVLQKTAIDFGRTELTYEHEEYKPNFPGNKKLTIRQTISFPTTYFSQKNLAGTNVLLAQKEFDLQRTELVRDVKEAFNRVLIEKEKLQLLTQQDSLYKNYLSASETRYKTGESSYLEQLSAKAKYQEIVLLKKNSESAVQSAELELERLVGNTVKVTGTPSRMRWNSKKNGSETSPFVNVQKAFVERAKSSNSLAQQQFLPDISIGYSAQRIDGFRGFQAYEIGFSFPIWLFPQVGQKQATTLQMRIAEKELENTRKKVDTEFESLKLKLSQLEAALNYYESTGLEQVKQLRLALAKAYQTGEIGYFEYLLNLNQALDIQTNYFGNLFEHNKIIFQLEFICGE